MNKLLGFGLALSMLVFFGSCKPKQSAYKSVYEAAKDREVVENKTTPTVVKPVYPAYNTNDTDVRVTAEKIQPVYEADASGLRAYSVVIASLSVKPNAEALKSRMEQEGYKIILAQNEQGMYRVIISSFDSKADAITSRNTIRDKYITKGSSDALRRTYGIPFDDLWILQRQY